MNRTASRELCAATSQASPDLKNVAKLPATAVMTKTAHISRPMSIALPAVVTGFGIDEDTVSSCAAVKNAASPTLWMAPPVCPCSVNHSSRVPATNTPP